MAKKSLNVKSALELSGAAVCVQTGTTTELNLADYFKANGLKYNPVVFEKEDDATSAYDAGRCDVYTTDQSGLYAIRLKLKNPDDNMVLPEVISRSRSDRLCVRATTSGSTWSAGFTMPW